MTTIVKKLVESNYKFQKQKIKNELDTLSNGFLHSKLILRSRGRHPFSTYLLSQRKVCLKEGSNSPYVFPIIIK